MFDWNWSSTGCWQSGFASQLWISRNEKTNLEFKKSGWCLPALHISHIPLAKRALWLSFITKIMIKIAQNSPVQHKNTRNSLVILFYFIFGTGQKRPKGGWTWEIMVKLEIPRRISIWGFVPKKYFTFAKKV